MNKVEDHRFEELLAAIIGLIPQASNPDAGAASGVGNLWVDSVTHKLNYKDPTGVNHVLPLTEADDALVAHLAGAEEFSGAKTFDDGTVLLFNAGKTFKTTLHALATAARSITFPDATGTALLGLGNALGGIRILTAAGANGAVAMALVGAKVGDKVLGISNITDGTTLLPTTDFEATITVNDQIQQVNVGNLSAKKLLVVLAANA